MSRPYYLTGPCPAWCALDHDDVQWAAEDRRHGSAENEITLTAMPAIVDEEDGKVVIEPRVLRASLEAHYREAEPRVNISHGEEADAAVYLTLAEAQELADNLLELIAAAHAAERGGTRY